MAASALPASAQRWGGNPPGVVDRIEAAPEHVGAGRYAIERVRPGDPPEVGDGVMYFGDVWREVKREEYVCDAAEEEQMSRDEQSCMAAFWETYDPEGYGRGLDLEGHARACVSGGGDPAICDDEEEDLKRARMTAFSEDCAEDAGCLSALEACSEIMLTCRETWTEWLHYDNRAFELPCRPFDYMRWKDKRVRDNWKNGRGQWTRLVRQVENRGFVGDPGLLDYLGLGGKPMWMEVRPGAVNAEGEPLEIGSYFFGDYRYGQIAFVSLETPGQLVQVTIPKEYKDAGLWRHAWIRDLYVCEETFTKEEMDELFKEWGILPPAQQEDQPIEYDPGY